MNNLNKNAEKTYYDAQVEFPIPIYGTLYILNMGILFLTDNWFYFIVFFFFVCFSIFFNPPLLWTLKNRKVLTYSLLMTYLFGTLVTYLLVRPGRHDPLLELTGKLLWPIVGIAISLILWRYYSREYLKNKGWSENRNK